MTTARRRLQKIDLTWSWAGVITTAHARLLQHLLAGVCSFTEIGWQQICRTCGLLPLFG